MGVRKEVADFASLEDGSLYVAADTVLRVSLDGGAVTTLVSGQSPSSMAVDATRVYWSNESSVFTSGASLRSASLAGGAVTTLVSGQAAILDIAVDATSAYWTDWDGFVLRTSLTPGGAVTTLASSSRSGDGNRRRCGERLLLRSRRHGGERASRRWVGGYACLGREPGRSGGGLDECLLDHDALRRPRCLQFGPGGRRSRPAKVEEVDPGTTARGRRRDALRRRGRLAGLQARRTTASVSRRRRMPSWRGPRSSKPV